MKRTKRLITSILCIALLLTSFSVAAFIPASGSSEEPLMTIACLSDLHTQGTDLSNIRLRDSVVDTLNDLKNTENIDLLILGGDYTSDTSSLSQSNFNSLKSVLYDACIGAFADSTSTPILAISGNHDYTAGKTSGYNSADLYTNFMDTATGTLSGDKDPAIKDGETAYYADFTDGSYSMSDVLVAYYYKIDGFYFVALNTDQYCYIKENGENSDYTNYRISDDSVTWVANALNKIYTEEPDSTVFFITHIGFADSNSIKDGKSLGESFASTQALKSTLAQYPNLIMLYGHDHGGDAAYTRTDSAQRVTQYDSDASVITTTNYTGQELASAGTGTTTNVGYYITNSGKYLCRSGNLNTASDACVSQITFTGSGTITMSVVNSSSAPSGESTSESNVYFSTSSKSFSGNRSASELYLYRVTSSGSSSVTATLVSDASGFVDGASYIIVGKNSSTYYAMTNVNASQGSYYALNGVTVTISGSTLTYSSSPSSIMWTINDSSITTTPETGTTSSFFSSFMGSMRYYSNSVESYYGNTYNSSNDWEPHIWQALLIYVYADRVELHMKNYGATGTFGSITLAETPTVYTSYRDQPSEPIVSTIALDRTEAAIDAGASLTLTATLTNSTESIVWDSSNKSVATVSGGTVTALSPGTTVITASTASGLSASCALTVNAAAASLTLDITSAEMHHGDIIALTATLTSSSETVLWSSSDTSVAFVENGEVTALALGATTITAYTASGLSAECAITVTEGPYIVIGTAEIILSSGTSQKLTAVLYGSDETILWRSDEDEIATVAPDGTVTAVAEGGTYVYAYTESGVECPCYISVMEAVTLSLDSYSLTLNEGDFSTLTATLSGSTATVLWKTSDSSIVRVSNGTLYAVTAGSATITAYVSGGPEASCYVTVNSVTHVITINLSSIRLGQAESYVLVATLTPNNETVLWRSENELIATVVGSDKTCTVTAVGTGSTTITAYAATGGTAVCSCTVYSVEPSAISITKDSATLDIGGQIILYYEINPYNAADKSVEWTSSENSVATVENGIITAISAGTTTITATTVNGLSDTCLITVNAPAPEDADVKLTSDHVAYMEAYSGTYFRPYNNVTRAMMAESLYALLSDETKAFFAPSSTQSLPYDDISGLTSSEKLAIATLYNAGIFDGIYDSSYFNATRAVTRAELCAVMAFFTDGSYSSSTLNRISDVSSSTSHAAAIAIAYENGWLTTDRRGRFKPTNSVSRLEFATYMNSFLGRTPSKVSYSGVTPVKYSDVKSSMSGYLEICEATTSHTPVYSGGYEIWHAYNS